LRAAAYYRPLTIQVQIHFLITFDVNIGAKFISFDQDL